MTRTLVDPLSTPLLEMTRSKTWLEVPESRAERGSSRRYREACKI